MSPPLSRMLLEGAGSQLRPRPTAGSQRQRSQNQGTPPHPRQRRDPSPCDPNAQAPSTMRRYRDLNLSQTHWYQMGKLRHREAVDLSEAHVKLRRGWEQTPPVAPARGGSPAHSLAPGNLPSQGDSVHGAWSPRGCLGVVLPHSCRAACLVPGGWRQGSRRRGVLTPPTGLGPAPAAPSLPLPALRTSAASGSISSREWGHVTLCAWSETQSSHPDQQGPAPVHPAPSPDALSPP